MATKRSAGDSPAPAPMAAEAPPPEIRDDGPPTDNARKAEEPMPFREGVSQQYYTDADFTDGVMYQVQLARAVQLDRRWIRPGQGLVMEGSVVRQIGVGNILNASAPAA